MTEETGVVQRQLSPKLILRERTRREEQVVWKHFQMDNQDVEFTGILCLLDLIENIVMIDRKKEIILVYLWAIACHHDLCRPEYDHYTTNFSQQSILYN